METDEKQLIEFAWPKLAFYNTGNDSTHSVFNELCRIKQAKESFQRKGPL